MSIAVVGDVHGDVRGLRGVLRRVTQLVDERAPVVFLGDYIDGGPDTMATIETMIRFRDSRPGLTRFLMGNHEQWMLRSFDDPTKHSWILSMRGLSTIGSYFAELEARFRSLMQETGPALLSDQLPLPYEEFRDGMPPEHLAFFHELDTSYEDEHCICSHAGLACHPDGLAGESERNLVWGSRAFPECYAGEKLVVYGHVSRLARLIGGVVVPHRQNNTICIDTSKYGAVSALILPEKRLVQSKPR